MSYSHVDPGGARSCDFTAEKDVPSGSLIPSPSFCLQKRTGASDDDILIVNPPGDPQKLEVQEPEPEYRLYKQRWIGVFAICCLNLVAGMCLVWFGPIATDVVAQLHFTIDEVNWLGNVINIVYIPTSALMPFLYARLGIRKACFVGAGLFVVSAWIRFAGTIVGDNARAAYALIIIAQIVAGMAQPIFQVLVPSYSEKWFDLKGRTTATMIMAIANPIGTALGQLISPLVGSPAQSILVMGIIYTAVTPAAFLIRDAPPTPPAPHSGHVTPSFLCLLRAMAGREPRGRPTYMSGRQRIDFAIVAAAFGASVGTINAFSILSAQILEPYGYSDTQSGLMGATILLTGIVAAGATAPLYDRVLAHRLALSCKVFAPFLGACWLVLIWAVRPNDAAGLFTLFAIIGALSLTLLPVVLELAVELTRNADGSSALLWILANLCGVVFVLVDGAIRAGPDANPPHNMRNALVLNGAIIMAVVFFALFIEGRQVRREHAEAALAARERMRTQGLEGGEGGDARTRSKRESAGTEAEWDKKEEIVQTEDVV